MSRENIHDGLKYWIIERAIRKTDSKGNAYYDEAYSGDTEPVDIRVRMKHFDYRPDVVLLRRGRKTTNLSNLKRGTSYSNYVRNNQRNFWT